MTSERDEQAAWADPARRIAELEAEVAEWKANARRWEQRAKANRERAEQLEATAAEVAAYTAAPDPQSAQQVMDRAIQRRVMRERARTETPVDDGGTLERIERKIDTLIGRSTR